MNYRNMEGFVMQGHASAEAQVEYLMKVVQIHMNTIKTLEERLEKERIEVSLTRLRMADEIRGLKRKIGELENGLLQTQPSEPPRKRSWWARWNKRV